MKFTNYNFKKMTGCKNYYFLNSIYEKKKLVNFNLNNQNINEILNQMFDNNGNDKIAKNDLTLQEYYEILHCKMKDYICEKIDINKTLENKKINIIYNNINFECIYDLFYEDEDNVNIFKFMSCKDTSIQTELGKRTALLKLVANNKFSHIYDVVLKKDIEKIKDKLYDIYFYKFIYQNSKYYNKYKNTHYYLVTLSDDFNDGEYFHIIDISKVLDNGYDLFKDIIKEFIQTIDQTDIDMVFDCDNKECKFYEICKNKSSKTKNAASEQIDKLALIEKFDKITYPIYYLDFETFSSPYPRFKGDKPYTVFTFQYSLIIQESKDSELVYKDYLALNNTDDIRHELFKQLTDEIDLSHGGSVLVFNDSCEKNRIKDASILFNDLSEKLNNINDHMIDLLKIVKGSKDHHNYYNLLQENSYSIKKLLPALTGKSYDNLDIKVGTEASNVYANFHNFSEEELNEYRKNLIVYCRQDTKSMYDILKVLKEKVSYQE